MKPVVLFAMAVLLSGSVAAFGQPTTQPATSQPAISPTHLVLEPSQGRPKILAPGDLFHFVLRLQPGVGGTIFVSLVHAQLGVVRHELDHEGPPTFYQDRYCTLVLRVPREAREGLYDLSVRGDGWTYRQPRCIKVVEQAKERWRFVHLSDMNIDDPSAPEFDETLPAEINILAPEFIVATGDFTEWGRTLNDPSGWPRVLAFFERFDAPVFLVCGDHDHQESYTPFVANSPVGSFDYGNYHGIILLDHAAHDLSPELVQWLRRDLAANRDSTFNFIVTHNDDLSFLRSLTEPSHLPTFVREHRLKMIITGGHTDWDGKEFADRLVGLDGLHYIRTAQASTCLRDRATGISHYRVIEVHGDQVSYEYPDDLAIENAQHSIPVGRLRLFYDGPNDGSRQRVTAIVQNALNQPFENCRVWLRVAKGTDAETQPQVAGGRMVQTFDAGRFWLCRVAVDVPDKGGTRVLVATEGALPAAVPVELTLEGSRELYFAPQRTPIGVQYFASSESLSLRLANPTETSITAFPVVRLNGNVVPIDEDDENSWPIRLDAGQSVDVPLRLTLGRVSTGAHLLQVFFLEDPLKRVTPFPVTLHLGESSTYNVRLSDSPPTQPANGERIPAGPTASTSP